MDKLLPAIVIIAAIVAILTMQMYALNQGINGTLYMLSVATVAGLASGFAGFKLKDIRNWWKK